MAEGKDGDQGPVAVGAFVLPNQEIDNSTALTAFLTPVEAVERYATLSIAITNCCSGRVDWSF